MISYLHYFVFVLPSHYTEAHVVQPVAPMTTCSLPAAQAVQTDDPALALKEPGTHGMHVSQPPGEKVPAGHAMHASAAGGE